MRIRAEQQIHIEQLRVSARVGVPRAERARRQRLVLNITLWPARDLRVYVGDRVLRGFADCTSRCSLIVPSALGRALATLH